MDMVKEGGKVIIPFDTYQYVSYGREGAELLLYILQFALEIPDQGDSLDVVGTR